MYGFVLFLHLIVTVLLVIVVLMQSGRGGGLTETFASAESMFGAKTSEVLVKATYILGSLFLILCLSLAILSTRKEQSLMANKMNVPLPKGTKFPLSTPMPAEPRSLEAPVSEAPAAAPQNIDMPQPAQATAAPAEPAPTESTPVPAESK